MTTLTTDPDSGIVAKLTSLKITCTDADNNDSGSYNASAYPTEPEILYYFKLSLSGQDDLKSNTFSTNSDGAAEWPGVLLPAAGTWTLALFTAADDQSVTSTSVSAS